MVDPMEELNVSKLAGEYYQWLTDNGGRGPDDLLALPLTAAQRQQLLEHMDNILTAFGLVAHE